MGLNKITRDTKEIIKYYSNKKENSISDNFIYDLYADNKGYLWVGTENNGLNKINIKSNEITQYLSNPEDSKALAGKEVRTILRDSRGIVWIATNNGLCRLDEERNEFLTFKSKIYDLQSIIQ